MNMNELESIRKRQWVGMLEIACRELELSSTQYEEAEKRYLAVADWIAGASNYLLANANIYPQGSARHQTTVRPIGSDEFDIDLVSNLPNVTRRAHPNSIHVLLGERLQEHAVYRNMLEPINRGWRLNYKGEFHLDLTPAVPDASIADEGIVVPDRTLVQWKESNPKGFAEWFDRLAALVPARITKFVEARADIEPLPEHEALRGPLRRIIQIEKRHRDLKYLNRSEAEREIAPISIILTTLSARAYERVVSEGLIDNEFDLVIATVVAMPQFVRRVSGIGYWIPNPSNPMENFAEKWNSDPRRAIAFLEWHAQFVSDLREFLRIEGLDRFGAHLAKLLGEDISRRTLSVYSNRLNKHRDAKRISVSASFGALGIVSPLSASVPTRKNTFFGNK